MKKKLYFQKKKIYNINKKGTFEKPRLSIFKSNKHIYVQLINDITNTTILSSSTLDKELFINNKLNLKKSFLIGKNIGLKCLKQKISNIFLDIKNQKYIGNIKNLILSLKKYNLIF